MLEEDLLSTTQNSPLDPESTSSNAESSMWVKILFGYVRFITGIIKFCFFITAQGGFALYTYMSVCIIISPYFALVTGIGEKNPLLITASILTLVVVSPLFELLIVLPFGIYKELWTGTRGCSPMSPLHWSLSVIETGMKLIFTKPSASATIIVFASCLAILMLIMIISFFIWPTKWASIAMLVFIAIPLCWGICNMLILFLKSWICMLNPYRLVENPTFPTRARWPFVKHWEKYLDDRKTNPINFLSRNATTSVHMLFLIAFIVLEILDTILLVKDFNPVFLVSTILNIVMFPFLIRFNITKAFTEFTGHETFRKAARGLLIVLIIIAITFTKNIITAVIKTPGEYIPYYGNGSTHPVQINTTETFLFPSMCQSYVGTLNIAQYTAMTEIPFDMKFGEGVYETKMSLIHGSHWNDTFKLINSTGNEYTRFVHIKDTRSDLDWIIIKGGETVSDSLLAYAMSSMYLVPENVFNMIPFATMVFSPLLGVLVPLFDTPANFYTPHPLLTDYIEPIWHYTKKLEDNGTKKIIVIGYGIGGSLSKAMGILRSYKAIGINSPEVRLWYMADIREESRKLSRSENLLIHGQQYVGYEEGGQVDYIPFENFPVNPAQVQDTLCTVVFQCGMFDQFTNYCNSTVDSEILQQIVANPDHIQ